MHAAPPTAHGRPKLYNPRHPERTLRYQTIAEHFETWFELASAGQFEGQGDHHTPKPYVRKAFCKYLECGIFADGFARARCGDCGHDYFVAYSRKGCGVCPSRNTRRMVRTAAHLTDHVFTRPPCAMERLRKEGAELLYRCAKQHSEPGYDKCGTKADELSLTPLELIDRIAALVPPSRTHLHPYFCVLAPNSPHSAYIRNLLQHIGEDSEPPRIAPSRGHPCGMTVRVPRGKRWWTTIQGIGSRAGC